MGEQTFRLTNIVRVEPDPSLFTVPADFNFKIVDGGPKTFVFCPEAMQDDIINWWASFPRRCFALAVLAGTVASARN
jgi:hypothetical protein